MKKTIIFWVLPLVVICFPAFASEFDPRSIYRATSNAVVLIVAYDQDQEVSSFGTGSIIKRNGLILTNAHVVMNEVQKRPFKKIMVFLKPERVTGDIDKDTMRKFKVKILDYSRDLDLAVLKINRITQEVPYFPFLLFSHSGKVEVGDPVLAIGHPEQGGLWTLTTGVIGSQLENFQGIRGKNVFQTEASINKGNSGGPLLDGMGGIIGINSNFSRKGKNGLAITGINFSIKSEVALKWLRSRGYSIDYKNPESFSKEVTKSNESLAGIDPVPFIPEQTSPQKRKPAGDPRILTGTHLYRKEDLYRQVEDELKDLMDEMKSKYRSKRISLEQG